MSLRLSAPPRWLTEIAWALACFLLAAVCAVAWTKSSKSEVGEEGTGLVALQEKAGRPPFIFRRLGPETSYLVWRIVPEQLWMKASELLHQSPALSREITLDWEWRREEEPRLLAHVVSLVLFFMIFAVSIRLLLPAIYDSPRWVQLLLPLVLMVLLLGGKGYKAGWHSYAYDIPNAAVFWLTLAFVVRGNWLAIPTMALAAYSKETSLLIPAAALLVWPSSVLKLRATIAGCMTLIYLAVRAYVHSTITALPYPHYSYILTNGFDILFPGNWVTLTVACLLLLTARDFWDYPAAIRRLSFIPLALLGVLTVKGWIYELRAYLEGMPIVVLMVMQTLAMRHGYQHLLRPRGQEGTDDGKSIGSRAIREFAREAYADASPLRRWMAVHRVSIAPLPTVLSYVPPNSTVLDVGCGNGLLLAVLAKHRVVSRAVGVDISETAIDIAQKARQRLGLSPSLLDFRAREPNRLLPDEQFDCVLLVDVLHHVPPDLQTSFLQDLAQRVVPGGRLIYKDMCREPRWRAIMNRVHDWLTERQWIHYYPVEQVERTLQDAGFSCIHRQSISMLWYGHELRVFERAPR